MPLLQLPPETLAQIFDYVGSSFFHEDLSRLTVCKQWLEFALPACLKCITLSQETLRSLITSETIKRPSPLKHSLESLDLELRGYDHSYHTTFNTQQNAPKSNILDAAASDASFKDTPVRTWIDVLNDDLAQLAVIAQQSRRLRTLRIQARSSPSPEDAINNSNDYLSLPTIRGLLSVENLSVLVLDLPIDFLNSSEAQERGLHICPAIGALLRTLQTLHIRMRSICPDVLKPHDLDNIPHLSVVIVNLSLITNEPGTTSAAHSKRCGSPAGPLQLIMDIQEQAQALAAQMASPRIVRVLTHSLPQFETRSSDVLTGKTMVLDDGMAWDEDGKTVTDDSEPESELPDDWFDNFLND
ncbi:hypothetical protein F4680DRAFT_418108 [Xylaria scruposa]|nr:hypothetical protein F4680DRAFT_418108 [Xylaria scruposa]